MERSCRLARVALCLSTAAIALLPAAGPAGAVATLVYQPVIEPEPAYTVGLTNTIYWTGVSADWWAGGSQTADGKPSNKRHYDLVIIDSATGKSRTIDVGGPSTTRYTVKTTDFPVSPDGRTFKYRVRASQHACQGGSPGLNLCQNYQTIYSPWTDFASSTQDAMPPVLHSVTLGNGEAFTKTLSVLVHLDASDIGSNGSGLAAIQYAHDLTFTCPKLAVCASAYATNTTVSLAPGADGPRTVYARVFDAAQAPGQGSVAVGSRSGTAFGLPPGNMSNSASDTIVLDTTGPKIVVTRTPEPQKAGKPVTFDGSQSVDQGGFNADSGVDAGTAVWDFGDGTRASGLAVSHNYGAAGSYTATLSLKDKVGNQSTLGVKVTIMPSDWGGTGTPTQSTGTPSSSPQQVDTTAPSLSGLRLSRVRGRLRLTVTLSEPATLIVQMERVRPRPRIVIAARSPNRAAGRSTLVLARVRAHARYRVLVAARDAAGNVSPTRILLANGPRRRR